MNTIGLRAHDLGMFDTAEELATAASLYGNDIPLQLAFKKVLRNALDPQAYTHEYIASVHDALQAKHIKVGVIGCYINPVHPDKESRESQLRSFEQHLKYARTLGCPVVGTETGSVQPDCSYHPETSEPNTLDILYRSIERLLETAVKYDAIVGVEAVSKQHTISTVDRMASLLEHFDTPHLRVIWDPVNLVPWTGIPELDGSCRAVPSREAQQSFIRNALDAFGDKIVAVHVKDYKLNDQGFKIGDLTVGEGALDWALIFAELRARSIAVPALLENLTLATLNTTLEKLRKL